MAKIELKRAGEEATLAIAEVEVLSGVNGNMVKFTTMTGDELAISEGAVLRQLDFCKVEELADLAGKIIHFSRKANKNPVHQPYWNLSLATEADIKKAANGNGKPPIAAKPEGMTVGRLPGEETETGGPPREASGDGYTQTGAQKQSGTSPKPTLDDLVHSYGQCLAKVVAQYKPWLEEKKISVTPESIAAMSATLFIERNRRGC